MKNSLKYIIGFSLSSWIGFVIGIISVPILTRLLEPAHFAAINQFLAVINLLMSIASFGLDSAYVRYYHEPPEGFTSAQLMGRILPFISLSIFVLGAFGLLVFRGSVAMLVGNETSIVIGFSIVIAVWAQAVIRMYTVRFRMENAILSYTAVALGLQLVSKFAALASIPFSKSVSSMLFACSVGLLALAFSILVPSILRGTISSSRASLLTDKTFIRYSIETWPVPVIIYANIYLSQMTVRNTLGADILGVFLSANIFASVLAVVQSGFSNYWSGFMFSNYREKQAKIADVHEYICFLSVVFLLLLVVFRDLAYLVIGPRYYESRKIFAMIASVPLFSMIIETTAYGTSIAKKAYLPLMGYTVYMIANVGLTFVLSPILGIYGAGLAAFLSAILNLTMQTFWGQKYYRSMKNSKSIISSVLLMSCLVGINAISSAGPSFYGLCLIAAGATVIVFWNQIKDLIGIALSNTMIDA